MAITKLANIPDDTVIGRAQVIVPRRCKCNSFPTIVNRGGTFTTIGAPTIVKTHTDGPTNVQALDIDSPKNY